MGIYDVLDNGQAKARSAGIACAALIHSVEALKRPGDLLSRIPNPSSPISTKMFSCMSKNRIYLSPILFSVFLRIVEEIGDHLFNARLIGMHPNGLLDVSLEF